MTRERHEDPHVGLQLDGDRVTGLGNAGKWVHGKHLPAQRRWWRLAGICLLATIALALLARHAMAEGPPVKKDATPVVAVLTINDCLLILQALNELDAGYRYVVAAGKPTESVETLRFKFPPKVRDAISHDIFALGTIQMEGQSANRRAQLEVIGSGSDPIKPGSKQAIQFDQRMADYTARPCAVPLDHFRKADLDLDKNDVPGSVLARLRPITDE